MKLFMDTDEMNFETISFSTTQQRLAWLIGRDAIVSYVSPNSDYLWLEEGRRPGWYKFGWSIGKEICEVKWVSVQEAAALRIQEMIGSGFDVERILKELGDSAAAKAIAPSPPVAVS